MTGEIATATDLKQLTAEVLGRALKAGATDAEVVAYEGEEFSALVRPRPGGNPAGVRLARNRPARVQRSEDGEYVVLRPVPRRSGSTRLRCHRSFENHQRRPLRRAAGRGRLRQARRRSRGSISRTSTRSLRPNALKLPAAAKRLRWHTIPVSRTPAAATSTRQPRTR